MWNKHQQGTRDPTKCLVCNAADAGTVACLNHG